MQLATNLMMLSLAVNDMSKAKAFYVDKLGLKVITDCRQDDQNWWVSLATSEGKTSITLTTNHENMQPGTMKLYLATSDVAATYEKLSAQDTEVGEIKDDLFGPGSGVQWCNLADPDGNQILLVQGLRPRLNP